MKYFLYSLILSFSIQAEDVYKTKVYPLLDKFCYDCHDPDDEDSESPFLETLKAEDIPKHRHVWSSVASQLRNRTMPPKRKKTQPTEKERKFLADWIHNYLRDSALKMPAYAGSVMTRRLNRDQYDNSLRDLTGLEFGFSDSLPVDGSGCEGFDNNAETLFLSPLLLERYLESAQTVLDKTIISPAYKKNLNKLKEIKAAKMSSELVTIFNKGEYEFTIKAAEAGKLNLVLFSNDIEVHRFGTSETKYHKAILNLSRGYYKLTLKNLSKVDIKLQNIELKSVSKTVPEDIKKAHQSIFKIKGEDQKERARKTIKAFAEKAFRRPLKIEEMNKLMTLYRRAASRDEPFENAIKLALKSVLVSPHFLFMVEESPKTKGLHKVTDLELASRLSYFLWSSMPDQALMSDAKSE